MTLSSKVLARIKLIMKEKKISAYKLSLESGISAACLNNWLNDENSNPTINNIEKIALALKVPVVELFEEHDSNAGADHNNFSKLFNVIERLNGEHRAVIYEMSKMLLSRQRAKKTNDKDKCGKPNGN